jgi:hypothetical protein
LRKPEKSGSLFYNYKVYSKIVFSLLHKHIKGYFSLVLLGLCDFAYRFIYVDIGSYGSNNDAGVWSSCTLRKAIESGALGIPMEKVK